MKNLEMTGKKLHFRYILTFVSILIIALIIGLNKTEESDEIINGYIEQISKHRAEDQVLDSLIRVLSWENMVLKDSILKKDESLDSLSKFIDSINIKYEKEITSIKDASADDHGIWFSAKLNSLK